MQRLILVSLTMLLVAGCDDFRAADITALGAACTTAPQIDFIAHEAPAPEAVIATLDQLLLARTTTFELPIFQRTEAADAMPYVNSLLGPGSRQPQEQFLVSMNPVPLFSQVEFAYGLP